VKKIIAIASALMLMACTPTSQELVYLDGAVAAADAAVAVLTTQGDISPVVAAEVIAAITPIPGAASNIITEFNSSDTVAVKTAKIALLSQPVINSLSSLSPEAAPYVAATLAAWQFFLASVQPPSPALLPRTVAISTSNAGTSNAKVSVKDVQAHIKALQARLAQFKFAQVK